MKLTIDTDKKEIIGDFSRSQGLLLLFVSAWLEDLGDDDEALVREWIEKIDPDGTYDLFSGDWSL